MWGWNTARKTGPVYFLGRDEGLTFDVLAGADFQPFGIAQYDLGTTFEPGSGDPFDSRPL
ncbi:hypothetical protein [Streptomyces sp. NPDC002265]|uniref:hypothetical protein n=1 Tax=Streptomyces sp. NPDC002265 TaxID=3154415 RepID=UPI003323401F